MEERGGFTVIREPIGRLTEQYKKDFDKLKDNSQEVYKEFKKDLVETAKAVYTEIEGFTSEAGLKDLPFDKVKKLKYLKNVETYLQAQLFALQKEISNITKID